MRWLITLALILCTGCADRVVYRMIRTEAVIRMQTPMLVAPWLGVRPAH